MSGEFEAILRRYGRAVTLYPRDGGAAMAGYAFLQPMPETKQSRRQRLPSPLGESCEARFLYLGSTALALDAAAFLCCEGRDYDIRQAQQIHLGRLPHHWRAILRLREEEGVL